MTQAERHAELMSCDSIETLSSAQALALIGELVDVSHDVGSAAGLNRAIDLSAQLQARVLTAEEGIDLHYFAGNAHLSLTSLADKRADWEHPHLERAIYAFRLALGAADQIAAPQKQRQCQALTNLANSLSDVGRVPEAIEIWERALELMPGYGMTIGSKGYGFFKYAYAVPDSGHATVLMTFARRHLAHALESPLESEGSRRFFMKRVADIDGVLANANDPDDEYLNSFTLGRSKAETRYRKWCLKHRLFVNPLNDLGEYAIAARDRAALPTIVRPIHEGPIFHGLFNQLKQEFTSARFLHFESMQGMRAHYADRGVYQYNTLDYPTYSVNAEKMKAAFRIAYSVFDKIAFFINAYWEFGVPPTRVSFRSIWYKAQQKDKGLRDGLEDMITWPLRALFWLSKDLSEDRPEFVDSMDPDSRMLAKIRNHLEHQYLKLHEGDWRGPSSDPAAKAMEDSLALSLYRTDFEAKTLRILKLVRSALLYLLMSVRMEEQRRRHARGDKTVMPMTIDAFKDDWKM
jgi:hypothetical protein